MSQESTQAISNAGNQKHYKSRNEDFNLHNGGRSWGNEGPGVELGIREEVTILVSLRGWAHPVLRRDGKGKACGRSVGSCGSG